MHWAAPQQDKVCRPGPHKLGLHRRKQGEYARTDALFRRGALHIACHCNTAQRSFPHLRTTLLAGRTGGLVHHTSNPESRAERTACHCNMLAPGSQIGCTPHLALNTAALLQGSVRMSEMSWHL